VADEFSGPDPFRREVKLELESIYYPLDSHCNWLPIAAEINNGRPRDLGHYPQAFERRPCGCVWLSSRMATIRRLRFIEARSTSCSSARMRETSRFATTHANAAILLVERRGGARPAVYRLLLSRSHANYSSNATLSDTGHGACVARNGRGVLLSGPSGAGKTSLAYFCARNGWTYISDNESWLVRSQPGLLLGNPHRIRFGTARASCFRN